MDEVVKFLTDAQTFYLATVEGDQPRVRPMGFVMNYKGRLYMGTNNTKDMYKQMKAHPKIEISAFGPEGKWIRVYGKVDFDTDIAAQEKALEVAPNLKKMYSAGDGKFAVFYFESGSTATIYDFAGNRKEIKL
ncbi:MAG: pyridoxamine 5'-phosphate oxidase family protein [Treponema sp.]|jgi:uncharacterized pyridoxamine 5'-phosphate oxidase family protein|nr:pyridoxamine 5'-phosphate oxidase family protein [Treponema sp.]